MRRLARVLIGVVMAVIGVFFLIVGYLGDDMWFPVHHSAQRAAEFAGLHHWETDPVGYLMAAMMWVLMIAVGVILIAQGLRGGRARR